MGPRQFVKSKRSYQVFARHHVYAVWFPLLWQYNWTAQKVDCPPFHSWSISELTTRNPYGMGSGNWPAFRPHAIDREFIIGFLAKISLRISAANWKVDTNALPAHFSAQIQYICVGAAVAESVPHAGVFSTLRKNCQPNYKMCRNLGCLKKN